MTARTCERLRGLSRSALRRRDASACWHNEIAAALHNTIQNNSLHHTPRAMLTAARRPDIHRVPHNHSPRHTQSHTLGHWTPRDSDRSEVTRRQRLTRPLDHGHTYAAPPCTRSSPDAHRGARLRVLRAAAIKQRGWVCSPTATAPLPHRLTWAGVLTFSKASRFRGGLLRSRGGVPVS